MKKILGNFAAVCIVAAGASGAVNAQNGKLNNMKSVNSFSEAAIAPVLKHRNFTVTDRHKGTKGQEIIIVKFSDGTIAQIAFTACNAKNNRCLGMDIVANWRPKAQYTAAQNAKFVSDFNNKFSFISAGIMGNGNMYLQRYAIADYGTNYGNINSELLNFASVARKFKTAIKERGK